MEKGPSWQNGLLPVHPDDFSLLGFAFEGDYYVDCMLPMGCFISCLAFEHFSTFLEWVLKEWNGCKAVVHYLDYFLFAGPMASGHCGHLLATFVALEHELGVPLVGDKTKGPV